MGRDYFAHDTAAGSGAEPPGYIPPPSYKRPFLYRGGQRSNGEALGNYQFQGEEIKEQVPGSTELGRWYSRQVGNSWVEHQRDRTAPCRDAAFPGRSEEEAEEEHLESVQYLPFDDPRVRHISGGSCGNSLVDSDKIGSIDKEAPSANVLGQSTQDSAFLPLQELLLLNTDTSKTSLSEQDGGSRQHSNLHKYRDQETQTCSPEGPRAPPQGPTDQQAQDQPRSASDTTTDSGVGTDCSNRYGYPMKGQKNLNQSSNSAFSRTFSGSLHKSTAQSPPPSQPQPSGNQEEPDYLPAQKGQNQSRGKPLSVGPGPEAFGQFLLKPISRRPWDAIEELESFNKELQQQIVKGSSVDQCIEDLDEAYKDILELETVSNNIIEKVQIPDHKKADPDGPDPIPLVEPLGRTGKARLTLESWTAAADPAYREVKSAFSRPAGKTVSFSFSKQPREEAPAPSEIGFREYTSILSQITDTPAGCHCRNANLDAFAPKESQHRDEADQPERTPVEVPWAARQPMQDASTLTSPPDYEAVCHALQLTRETTVGVSRGVTAKLGNTSTATLPQTSSFKVVTFATGSLQDGLSSQAEALRQTKKDKNSLPRFRGERSLNVLMVKSQRDRFRGRGASRCMVGKDTDGTVVASSSSEDDDFNDDDDKCFDSRRQLTITEKHLEALLTNEKSNSSTPAEDLSNLYEVKCAKGIPENESIEERAARILGIDVPAESLGVVEQKGGEQVSESEKGDTVEFKRIPLIGTLKFGSIERIPHVLWRRRKELDVDSVVLEWQDKEMGGATEHGGGDGLNRNGVENHLGPAPAFPEFPAERLKLSVALDRRGGRGRGRGPSRVIEALQDRLATPPCRAVAERLARMREVDSVSRMRRLSARSSDSGEEPEDGESRNTTVAKREITLPLGFCAPSNRPQDEGTLSLPDHYDPSQVERV
ncbi:hypothetical protein SKAU_G00376140 [Synaphobranchus kaupii]|uniref:Junctional protein associated with coronary artery disease n=1 Tax=Synaphobranchus kaupii TaxID=118154 RepID=A0A9Q1ECR3_SYNKA|nr:hypothetical protein SKAU_G00376140 [Synaphobranchus kaupii]